MYRVSMDFTAPQYVQFLKDQPAGKQLFSLEITDAETPIVLKDVEPPKPRKPRRTKAQIAADEAGALANAATKPSIADPDANQRAFPWQDKAMNNGAA